MNKVLICSNVQRDEKLKTTLDVVAFLRGLNVEPSVSLLFAGEVSRIPECLKVVPFEEAVSRAELIICLGGDGTILHTAKGAAKNSVPILGINIGKTGFLADLEANDYRLLEKALRGDYVSDRRMMIDVSIMRSGTEIFRDFGLNDAVVSRGGAGRTIDLTLSGDGKRLYRFSGDGIIVATPTGSTAYSLAAGGAIVEPSAENIIVTPICAHTLKVKSLVMPAGARVSVEIGELRDKAAFLSVDGADSVVLMQDDVITMTRSSYSAVLVRVLNKSFYDIISLKLGSGDVI